MNQSHTRRRLAVVTLEEEAKRRYVKELRRFFKGYLDVEGYCVKTSIDTPIEGDLVVISSPIATDFVKPYLAEDVEIIYLARTFLKGSLKKLENLPRGTRAMFVDYCRISSVEIISLLYEKGIKNIDFTPVYMDMEAEQVPDLDIAVTPGLLSYVPSRARKVIDLGWTVIALSTLMEIATKLKIFDKELERRLFQYSSTILPIGLGLVYALRSNSEIKNQWDIVLKVIDDGVVVTDKNGIILHFNQSMHRILDIPERGFFQTSLKDVIQYEGLREKLFENSTMENKLLKIEEINKSVLVTKRLIKAAGFIHGYIIIIKDVTEIERLENRLRKQLNDRGHVARYYFKDIIGSGSLITERVRKAKKLSKIEANLLLTGESGTGKELFAQSIHNDSSRARGPFVAINCAALPQELLESELFGYEEGAFTSARKGGKKGLFELAHQGTIFLDEIGEIPINVQAKLLRVLQEKEVMRIGSTSTIPVDVRVIAATNRDLKEQMNRGSFRKDLYYRISVFALHLPPLRDRKEDIPAFIDHFIDAKGRRKVLEPALLRFLTEWEWEGNIRELINCVEYLSYMGGDTLTMEDLPPGFRTSGPGQESCGRNTRTFPELLPEEEETALAIMRILSYRNLGRRAVHRILLSRGYSVSEYGIRKLMDLLQHREFVSTGTGRAGTSLTGPGKRYLAEVDTPRTPDPR